MVSNHTPNYNLNQWQAADQVKRTDFNEDNAKIEAAILNKIGKAEIIKETFSNGTSADNIHCAAPVNNWGDWEYICFLAQYPGITTETYELEFCLTGNESQTKRISPLPLIGYMVVLLPWHDASRPAAGFVFSNRFIPFSCGFSFADITKISFGIKRNLSAIHPNIVIFGGK